MMKEDGKTVSFAIRRDGYFDLTVSDGYELTVPFEMVDTMKESMDHLEYHIINNISLDAVCDFYKNKDKEHQQFG